MKIAIRIFVVFTTLSLLVSCDMLCRLAGKPTKSELRTRKIEALAAQMQKVYDDSLTVAKAIEDSLAVVKAHEDSLAAIQAHEDSLAAAKAREDSLALLQSVELEYEYYVVLGVHRDRNLAQEKCDRAQREGFRTVVYYNPDKQFYYVLSGGTNSTKEISKLKKNPKLNRITSNIWTYHR